jgi:hypothetical protein
LALGLELEDAITKGEMNKSRRNQITPNPEASLRAENQNYLGSGTKDLTNSKLKTKVTPGADIEENQDELLKGRPDIPERKRNKHTRLRHALNEHFG